MSNLQKTLDEAPEKIEAQWSLSLDCDCPHCKQFVDLLLSADFWDGRELEIAEHGTKRSKDVEVNCPECGESFVVDLVY